MVEAQCEGLINRQRAAEADAAMHLKLRATLRQKPNELQEILVPTNRDPVFGHAAEAGHSPAAQRLADAVDPANGEERMAGAVGLNAGEAWRQRLDLQAVNAKHCVAVIEEVVCEREPGGAQAHHEHGAPARRLRQRPAEVQRIPARQQTVESRTPTGGPEHP